MSDEPEEKVMIDQEIPVTVIAHDKGTSLVQFVEGNSVRRVTLKSKRIVDGFALKSVLETEGIQFGIDWNEFAYTLNFQFDPETLDDAMHTHSLWTAEDIRSNPGQVFAAVQTLFAPLITSIMQFIRDK